MREGARSFALSKRGPRSRTKYRSTLFGDSEPFVYTGGTDAGLGRNPYRVATFFGDSPTFFELATVGLEATRGKAAD